MKLVIATAALLTLVACGQKETVNPPYVDPVPEAAVSFLDACIAGQANGEDVSAECLCAIEAADGGQCDPTGTVVVETQAAPEVTEEAAEVEGLEDPK